MQGTQPLPVYVLNDTSQTTLTLAVLQTMVFSKKMGAALNDVPLFGTAFNNWFPIVVLFWCGALFLNVWQTIARLILPARYRFDDRSSGNEHMERGQLLMRKEEVHFDAVVPLH